MADLADLFTRLKSAQSSTPPQPVSSPSPTMETSSSDRTANLLNLLKFNQPSAKQDSLGTTSPTENRVISPSEPVATLARKPSSSSGVTRSPGLGSRSASASKPNIASPLSSSATQNPQDLLLRLLNRPQSQPPEPPLKNIELESTVTLGTAQAAPEASRGSRSETPIRTFGIEERQPSPFEPPLQTNKGSIFTYVNPFDDLAASSPRNKTPKLETRAGHVDILKRPNAEPTAASDPIVESIEKDVASDKPQESVSGALSEVAQQADKQLDEALAKAEAQNEPRELPLGSEAGHPFTKREIERAVKEVAAEIKDGFDRNDPDLQLVKTMSKPMENALRETVNEIADQDNVVDSWESADAEDSPAKEEDENTVKVLNLPMKPFTAIDINDMPPSPHKLRQDVIMEVARLKKEFDQMDRTLATASSNFIVYALTKGGGFRIIRQDSGLAKQVFKGNEHKIYNVAIGSSSPGSIRPGSEVVVGTGVNGSVYWVTIANTKGDSFEEENLEEHGFILPPMSSQEDYNAGMQLKTRVKRSSRHPEYFAIGRGKNINIIWPAIAMSPPYIDPVSRQVNTEKYLAEHSLKIQTNKAGKDFAFSEDDTLIVSLDKSGRLKFWDILDMIDPANERPGKMPAIDIKTPLMTLLTVNPSVEKSWPTSVMFVDKDRPTAKGNALRYLLLGMKQNHTLQLWDLGLGKPVQELNFPHENESDAICSIGYHAKSGIITVGHPTRNSIYFIHLSAPRYNLPLLSQASYVRRLALKDPYLPKPESTAIMSGIREISFSARGVLRSLEVLNPAIPTVEERETDETTIFELYAMHSKGVTCLNIKRQDLGWDSDHRVIQPVDAVATGAVTVRALLDTNTVEETQVKSSSQAAPATSTPIKNAEASAAVSGNNAASPAPKPGTKPFSTPSTQPINQHSTDTSPPPESSITREASKTSWAGVAQKGFEAQPVLAKPSTASKDIKSTATSSKPTTNGTSSEDVGSSVPGLTNGDLAQVVKQQLDQLYRRFEEDKRVQEAAGAAKQDAVLRLVSSTLTDNVEKSLTRIVDSSIQQTVLPSLTNSATRKLSETLTQHLNSMVPRELKLAIPAAVNSAMQDPEVLRIIADMVSNTVSAHVERTFSATLHKDVFPAFKNLAIGAAQKSVGEVERRVQDQLSHFDLQRQNDAAKIEQLTKVTQEMSELVRAMAISQTSIQRELVDMKRQRSASSQHGPSDGLQVTSSRSQPRQEPRDEELHTINTMMQEGKFQEATVMWLQSPRQTQLFDLLFARLNPGYLQRVSHLTTLSVAAALSGTLDAAVAANSHVAERLAYLDAIFSAVDPYDPDIAELASQIIDVITGRLQGAYMLLSEKSPGDPLLARIHRLVRLVRDVGAAAG